MSSENSTMDFSAGGNVTMGSKKMDTIKARKIKGWRELKHGKKSRTKGNTCSMDK